MLAPSAYPIVGHVPPWLIDKFGFLRRCAASKMLICELKLGKRAYLLNFHEDIKHVLETNYTNYLKNARLSDQRGKRLFGEGVQTQYGSQHQHQRRQVQPVFIRRAIATFAPQIVATVDSYLSGWCDRVEIDAAGSILQLVHCVMGQLLFGLDFGQTDIALGNAVLARRRQVNDQFSLKALLRHTSSSPSALRRLEQAVEQMIQARRHCPGHHRDLLSLLVQRQPLHSDTATQQLRDEALATSGGYETIAALIIWTIYWLALHPQVEANFLQESAQVVGNRLPTADDLPQLQYAKMVISESLRLCPPTWIFTRIAQQSDRLPSGTMLAPGDKLYLSPYVLHQNPGYFPNPEKFDPQRFSKAQLRTHPEYAYFPFGGGPRVCIGQALVETVAVLILVAITQRVRLKLVPNQRVVPKTSITLLPNRPLKMHVYPAPAA